MNRLVALPLLATGLLVAFMSLGFVHGEIPTAGVLLTAGMTFIAAAGFVLVVGYPGVFKSRGRWIISFVLYLLVVVGLVRFAWFGGPVEKPVATPVPSAGSFPMVVCGSDSPWTIVEALDEERAPLLKRCDQLRHDLLGKADSSCEQASGCVGTSGRVAVSRKSARLAQEFERLWASSGCPAKDALRTAPLLCENHLCRY